MEKITAEKVKEQVTKSGIIKIDHHECTFCKYMTHYVVTDETLFFDSGCDCVSPHAPIRQVTWESLADWINMQTQEKWRNDILDKCGFNATRPF